MAKETELLKEVWRGCIAVRFTLASHEITSSGKPIPLYLMLQRNSYLPLVNDRVRKHFSAFVDEAKGSDIWFDHNGTPLRWHYPLGVLFDMVYGKCIDIPMDITVHFQDFPEDNILRFEQTDVVEAHFMSTLKEADQLKHRGQVINSMNKTQHKQLWHSLRNGNFDQFWSVNGKLMEAYECTDAFKYIPVRIYYENGVFQRLVSRSDETEHSKNTTLRDSVLEVLGLYFPNNCIDELDVITHGIECDLDNDMQWLSEHLSYADNFLHIILKRCNARQSCDS